MNIITPKNIENSTIREQYLNALLHMAELKKSEGAQSIKAILRIAAGALEIDKVSVWHVIEEMDMIIRQYLYESQSNHFSEKPITHNINERSPFLDTIRKNQVVIINNVHTDLARCEFIEKYLTSENIMALLYIPVWCYGQMISMLCCEQVNFEREWTEEDEKFAISVSNMLSITIEMTERYQTEQKLQEQQRFIENIANASPNILYVYNVLENNIQYISHSLYDILGYDVHEFQTMTLEQIISLIHQDDISLLSNHYAQLEQCDMGKVLEVEFRIHHKNGQWRWLYSSDLVFERTSDGRVSETLGSAQDITERKQIINELRQAKRTAELANRAKNEFLANITHELRTPLHAILGYAQILQKDTNLGESYKETLTTIYDSGKYLLDLINDILDLTKADVGQINIEINNFHLPNFLKGIVDTCHSRIKEKNITFTYKHDTHIPTYVKTDARRLRQILMNILDNAIKFTKQGEITFTVNLCSSQEIPESVLYTLPISPKNNVLLVRFQIKDTGIGIPNDELNSIFESFKQVTYPYHFVEGTGLGLFIGQRLANLMGSKIKVKSTIEKGSIFWFDMPLVKIPVQATSQAGTQKMIIGFEGDDTQHILIIDDKPDSCAVLRDILVPLGFEVTEAFSGFEGLKKARQIQPDIILVDLRMPNMDGFELTRQIRQILELQTTIVIAISASATEEIRQASLAAGCDDFLAKPVEMLLMLQCLERHLPLKWLYNIDDRISTYNSKNVQSEFVIPPPEEIAKLQELVQIGDVVGIWEWVEKIEQLGSQFQPYAIEVHKLAKQFRMTEIHELIEMMQTS